MIIPYLSGMKAMLLVTLGGALGSLLRYLLSDFVKTIHTSVFPWSTLLVNVVGCLVMGGIFAWSFHLNAFENIRLFFMIGVLGGFTTFSSFGLETFVLIREQHYLHAASYVLCSNILGLAAVFLGYFSFNQAV